MNTDINLLHWLGLLLAFLLTACAAGPAPKPSPAQTENEKLADESAQVTVT